MPAFVSPNGDYVEIMDLWCISKPKRHYDPRGGDGTYLKVSAGGRTIMYVTGPRKGHTAEGEDRSIDDAWDEVEELIGMSRAELELTDKTGQLQYIPSGKIKKRSR